MPEPESNTIAPEAAFRACIHCGLCLSSCPTYVETGREAESPRGRIQLMQALAEERVAPTRDAARHLDLCLGCRACETACPSGVEYGLLIEGARGFVESRVRRPLRERWRRRLLARVLPEARIVGAWRPLFAAATRVGLPRLAAAAWLPLSLRRLAALLPDPEAPRTSSGPFRARGERRGRVALLTGCVSEAMFPQTTELAARLLALAGYDVFLPERAVCCGALPTHLGATARAGRLARKTTNALLRLETDWIATTAAGCGAHLREYGRLLEGDETYRKGATEVGPKVRDVSELLLEGNLPEPPNAVERRVAYHEACHLVHGQRVIDPPRELLRRIPGLELVEVPDALCCGSAGTYNLTEPAMAWRLGERKARALLSTHADAVAAANPGCILQIRAALRFLGHDLPIRHPVALLAEAHGLL